MQIQEFASDYTGAFAKMDPKHPYYHLNVGLFHLPCEHQEAKAFVYIPESTSCSCWSVAILLPDSITVQDFLIKSGWKTIADDNKVVLFLAQPNGSWNTGEEGIAFVEELRSKLDVRDHYVTQVFFAYLVGYGTGATVGLRYTQKHPDAYAGVGFAGEFEFTEADIESANHAPAALPYVLAAEIPVPVYFQVSNETEAFCHAVEDFKRRNHTCKRTYRDNHRFIAPATQVQPRDTINGQPVADVIADVAAFDDVLSPKAAEEMWKLVHRTIRTTGIGPGGLHKYRTLEELGITTHEMEIDGYTRHWCEYIPKRNVSRSKKRPIVVFCHGGTQVAESGLYGAEWFNVAESRDFIALFPSGGMAQTRMNANPMPTWNISCKGLEDYYLDDEKFIRAMIADVAAREEIEYSRIYVTGHSMGSGMTQRCLLDMPDLFAAGASNSGVMLSDFETATTQTNFDVACLVEISEHDVDSFDLSDSKMVVRNLKYWIDRGNLEPFETNHGYSCGRYTNRVWRNKDGVPMLRYIAAFDKIHCVMPQDAWTYYDDFLCQFARGDNGSLLYLGVPVR